MSGERIRVLIAGNIYVKRALVRRFLEDDGYEVVGEALTRSDILPAIRRGSPDAVVVDDELLEEGTLGRIRKTAPDAKIVVFTSTPPASAAWMVGADAYLEKGVGLAALTALLVRLFEPDRDAAALLVAAGVGATAAADPEPVAASTAAGASAAGLSARFVSIGAGALLIVVGLIAMLSTGGGGTTPAPADTTDQTDQGTVVAQPAPTELDAAYAALDRMIDAIEGNNYVLASVEAQTLMDAREDARAAGYATSGLDAQVSARLVVVVDTIPGGATTTLQTILGTLYPDVSEDETTPGGGSDVVLGDTATSGTGTTSDTSTDSGSGTDSTTDGGGSTTGGNGGGGDTGSTEPGPGDGRVWGQWHKEHKGPGGPPPWANGGGNDG